MDMHISGVVYLCNCIVVRLYSYGVVTLLNG